MAIGGDNSRLRLAAARATDEQLRELVAILLAQGDAVFASRSWRVGSAITGALARVARLFGGAPSAAQSASHWHDIVDAHYDRLQRLRVLLEQRCESSDVVQNVDGALAQHWQRVGEERVLRGPA